MNRKKEVTTAFLEGLLRGGNSAANQVSVSPLEHGRRYEDDAAKEYVAIMHLHDKTARSSTVWLLHSPTSQLHIVYDPSVQPRHGLLGVKCPIRLFDNDLTSHDACMTYPDFCCSLQGGKVSLKHTHPYYFQVQGQMAVCGMSWCDFVVWAGSGRIFVERIN